MSPFDDKKMLPKPPPPPRQPAAPTTPKQKNDEWYPGKYIMQAAVQAAIAAREKMDELPSLGASSLPPSGSAAVATLFAGGFLLNVLKIPYSAREFVFTYSLSLQLFSFRFKPA